MKRWAIVGAAVLAMAAAQTVRAEAGDSRLGVGLYYNIPVDSSSEFEPDALSYLITYQFDLSLVTLEADLEILPSKLTGDETEFMPQAYVLFGGLIYVGAGIGVPLGGESKDPWYAFRLGVDIPLSKVHVDVNANYRFADWGKIDFDSDLITIGAAVRYVF